MPEFLSVEMLVNELQARFPMFNPTPDDTMETIMHRAGQRSVVDWIVNRIDNDDG